jgi:hypothetical protein
MSCCQEDCFRSRELTKILSSEVPNCADGHRRELPLECSRLTWSIAAGSRRMNGFVTLREVCDIKGPPVEENLCKGSHKQPDTPLFILEITALQTI